MTAEEERRKAQEMLEEARRKIRAQQEARAREAEEKKRREEMDRRLAEARARAQAELAAQETSDEAEQEQEKLPAEHTVQPGDTLSGIALKYYGDARQWPKIYEANKDVIGDDPNLIRPGQVLKIPKLDA